MGPFDFKTPVPWEKLGLGTQPVPSLLALRHAVEFRIPGVWADTPGTPNALMLVRDGDGKHLEVFGAGSPETAIPWLQKQARPFTLAAPDPWFAAVTEKLGKGRASAVETWIEADPGEEARPLNPRIRVDALGTKDARAFLTAAPPWALRGWRSFDRLIADAAAFAIEEPRTGEFIALAWVFDLAEPYASIGVFTAERYRNLGLGRAVVGRLIDHLHLETELSPLWSAGTDGRNSLALAEAMGFLPSVEETIMQWNSV